MFLPLLSESKTSPPSYRTLGVTVHAVQIPEVVERMESWIDQPSDASRWIAVTGMHGVREAQSDPRLLRVLNQADLVVPDGMPLVWLARRNGLPLERRVYGPELMETFLTETGGRYRHFLYGGAPGVAEKLAEVMQSRFGSVIAGAYCPPFRPLTEVETDEVVRLINESGADVVWVGLSTPKQELWMNEYRDRLDASVMVGVGAAFDFLTGTKSSGPRWMQEHGLQWLYRLSREPRRLWRRYLVGGAVFLFYLLLERLGLRKTD